MISPLPRLLLLAALGLSTLLATSARADDCPPGSVFRSEDGYTWCEPTVCENDGQCKTTEVCRPVPLCMQVGTLSADAAVLGDAGKRLVVTQACAPDKSCPQTTVCSDMTRCLPRTAAERMGLLTTSAPSAAPATGAAGEKKSSCGCDVVGGGGPAPLGAAALALALAGSIARRRPSSRRPR